MIAAVPFRRDLVLAVQRWSAGRRAVSPLARPAWRLLGGAAVVILLLVAATGFAVEEHDFAVMLALLGGGVAAALAMRWCRFARLADAVEGSALILAGGMATGCLSILLATIAPPLRDAELAAADAWLFPLLSWPTMARAAVTHPGAVAAMQALYSTLLWQPFALVALLALVERGEALWRFVHAWLLALAACLAIFALVPAVTAQVHYGVAQGSIPGLTVNAGWRPTEILMQVRGGTLRTLASGSMAGMICFPSFHAMGATLLGWGFAKAGAIGRPMVALNIVMIPAIPLIGSHYFVDVAAGVAMAGLVIVATRPSPPQPGAPLRR